MALRIETKLPTRLPAKARVYELARPKVSATGLKAAARGIGLTGKEFDLLTATDRLGYAGQRWNIEVHRASGAMVAVDTDRYGIDTGRPFELSDRRAEGLARKFLEASKLVPLKSAQLLKVTHLNGADADIKSQKITQRVIDAGVLYGRVVDDLPVTGPGGQAMVHLNADGEVVGLRSIWRPLGKALGTVKIQPIGAAVERLEKMVSSAVGEASLVKAHFGYFEWGALDRQTVLELVYVLVYVLRNGHIASKHVHIEHAGHQAHGKLMGRRVSRRWRRSRGGWVRGVEFRAQRPQGAGSSSCRAPGRD